MPEDNQIENFKIPLKTVISIVIWVSSLVGTYYVMQGKIEDLQVKTIKLEERLEKYDPAVTDYKLSDLQTKLKQIDEKTDRIYSAVMSGNK